MAMSAGGDGELNSEINVTPMVDIMLVLLIIFMITAPMMNTGVDVDLPKVTAKDIEDPEGKLILAIDKTQSLHLGGTRVPWQELSTKLSTNERVKKESALYIDADQSIPYGIVVTAMAVAKNAGVEKVMMMTEASDDANLAAKLGQLDTTAGLAAPSSDSAAPQNK